MGWRSPGLVLTGKDQLPQGMGILAAQKLSGWHQLLKLKASKEITLRLHQTKKQAKEMNGKKKKDEQEEKLLAMQKGKENGSRDGEKGLEPSVWERAGHN